MRSYDRSCAVRFWIFFTRQVLEILTDRTTKVATKLSPFTKSLHFQSLWARILRGRKSKNLFELEQLQRACSRTVIHTDNVRPIKLEQLQRVCAWTILRTDNVYTTLAKKIVTAEIFMRLISSAIVWYRASVRHRRDPRHCASRSRVADRSRCRMISHDRTADQSHEYLSCNDFFGQGSTIDTWTVRFWNLDRPNHKTTKATKPRKCAQTKTFW